MRDNDACRILVTGAAGLIGTETTHVMRQLGYDITTLDIKQRDQRGESISHVGNLLDPLVRREALRDVDGVIHLAALSRVEEAEADPDECIRVNLEGTKALLIDMTARRCSPWFIFASSREVYGEPKWLPVDEGHTLSPLNHYGRTKVACEQLVRTYASSVGRSGTILRFSNVYGSALDHEDRLVPSFIQRALLDQELRVFGGEQVLDLLYVRDAAFVIERVVSIIEHDEQWGAILNVGSGEGTSMKDLIGLIERIIDKRVSIRLEPSRPGSVASYITDTKQMKRTLGIECRTPLEEGLIGLVDRFRLRLEPLRMVVA